MIQFQLAAICSLFMCRSILCSPFKTTCAFSQSRGPTTSGHHGTAGLIPRFVSLQCFLKPKNGGGARCYCRNLLHVTRGHDVMYILHLFISPGVYIYMYIYILNNYWDSCTCYFHICFCWFVLSQRGSIQKLHSAREAKLIFRSLG